MANTPPHPPPPAAAQPALPTLASRTPAAQAPRRRLGERGVASVEAVIVLPVLILLFAGIRFVGTKHEARLQAQERARASAWAASLGGCEDAPSQPAELGSEFDAVRRGVDEVATSSTGSSVGLPIQGVVGDLLNGGLGALFGESVVTEQSLAVARPEYLGGGRVVMAAEAALPCNLKPQTLWDVASALWSKLTPW